MHLPAKKSALPKPDSLLDMCKSKILQTKFLVQCLPVSYARVLYSIQKYDYIQNSHIKRATFNSLKNLQKTTKSKMELFAYPKF